MARWLEHWMTSKIEVFLSKLRLRTTSPPKAVLKPQGGSPRWVAAVGNRSPSSKLLDIALNALKKIAPFEIIFLNRTTITSKPFLILAQLGILERELIFLLKKFMGNVFMGYDIGHSVRGRMMLELCSLYLNQNQTPKQEAVLGELLQRGTRINAVFFFLKI